MASLAKRNLILRHLKTVQVANSPVRNGPVCFTARLCSKIIPAAFNFPAEFQTGFTQAKACLAAAGKARLHLSHFDCGLLKGNYDAISLGRGTEEYFLYSYWKSV
jgi:hypothetical protein